MKARTLVLVFLGVAVIGGLVLVGGSLVARQLAKNVGFPAAAPAYYEAPMAPAEFVAESGRPAADGFASPSMPDVAAAQERLVIQTSSLTIVVTDPVAHSAAIRRLAEGMGGFVVSSNIYQTSVGPNALVVNYASITVRVPSARLPEAIEQIKVDSIEVRSETLSGEDVTSQYVDLESRLRNLEAAERQLARIMDGAEKTEDVLAVYSELVRVRGEIEMVRGQMNYFEEAAALSAITVELVPDEAAQPIDIGGWQPQGTAKQAIEALVRALQGIADAAIWLVIYVLPIGLLLGLPILLVVRRLRRRRSPAPPGPSAS